MGEPCQAVILSGVTGCRNKGIQKIPLVSKIIKGLPQVAGREELFPGGPFGYFMISFTPQHRRISKNISQVTISIYEISNGAGFDGLAGFFWVAHVFSAPDFRVL